MELPVVNHPDYEAKIGDDNKFPIKKFGELASFLKKEKVVKKFYKPDPCSVDTLKEVHSEEYIFKIKNKTLEQRLVKKIGFPLVDSVVRRSLVATGGTVLASKLAINYGIACNTAGGSHHAIYDEGAGFCVFNDVAVAAKYLLNRGLANKILIVDLDVHQGNGNSEIFKNENNVFTFSMHLDDRLGKLCITDKGIDKRDEMVIGNFFKRRVPICGVLGGGYNKDFKKLIELHASLHKNCAKYLNDKK